jgi:hypothetical protein
MSHQQLQPNSILRSAPACTIDSSRCQHRTPAGRRCRSAVSHSSSNLCHTHFRPLEKQREAEELARTLIGELTTFQSAFDINEVLSKLFILLSQDRISSRRAAVLAYIGNLLLRTLPAMAQESDDDETGPITFGAPPPPSQSANQPQ